MTPEEMTERILAARDKALRSPLGPVEETNVDQIADPILERPWLDRRFRRMNSTNSSSLASAICAETSV